MAFIVLAVTVPCAFSSCTFSRSELTCSRAANECRVLVFAGPEILRHKRSYPLSSIKSAVIDSSWSPKIRDHLKGIALDVAGVVTLIDDYSNANNDLKEEWVQTVNQFLHDSSRESLEVHYGSTWPAFITSGICLLILVGYARARLRLIVNGNERNVQIEQRIFRTTVKTLPLDSVVEAFIHEIDSSKGNAKLQGVALRLSEGPPVVLEGHSSVERRAKMELIYEINQALEEARDR